MNYINYNKNPKQWKHEGDCVIRAIATAESKDWKETYQELVEYGLKCCRVINSKNCYEKLLKKHGWIKMPQPKHSDNSKYTVAELIKMHPDELLLITMRRHITVAVKGNLLDTWNCSEQYVSNYFVNDYYNSIIDETDFKKSDRILL